MTELVDPQLQAFFDSDPEILWAPEPPPIVPGGKVPAWYDNTVVELAGAILAVRGLVALSLLRQGPPPPGGVQILAAQEWQRHSPTWLKFTAPAIERVYESGRIEGLTDDEMEAMATDYAAGLGDYLDETSGEALAEGFQTQLDDRWDASLAWHRAASGYGLDRPGMRSYLRAVLNQPKGQRDPIGTAAKMLADRLLIARADRVAEAETWTANQSGLATSWIVRQQRGDISPDATRRWRTRHGETVCEICGPMDGQEVGLTEPFKSANGDLFSPGAHPGCMCSQELVEPVAKSKRLDDGTVDPYDRRKDGKFARREERTRNVTHLADPIVRSPEVQAIFDQLDGIAPVEEVKERISPFEVDRKAASPFAQAGKGSPFEQRISPFEVATTSPFGVDTRSPFDQPSAFQQGPGKVRPKRKMIVHHTFAPGKKPGHEEEYERNYDGHYLHADKLHAVYEESPRLIPRGDLFDFSDASANNAEQEVGKGGTSTEVEAVYEAALQEQQRFRGDKPPPNMEGFLTPDYMPPELLDLFALDAERTNDAWKALGLSDEYDNSGAGGSEPDWLNVLPLALEAFDEVMENPRTYAEKLSPRELQHIYDVAGYEYAGSPNENNDKDHGISHIVLRCEQHGSGDDSLSEAFADYVVWNRQDLLGSTGAGLKKKLEDADENYAPEMTDNINLRVTTAAHQYFVFDHGFHPDTQMRGQRDQTASLTGFYKVHHVMYRSNLGENREDALAFVTGIRELGAWPSDSEGHYLSGGPYRDIG